MDQEANKTLVRQFFEASTAGDIFAMVDGWAFDAVNHGRFNENAPLQQRPPSGKDGLMRVFESLHNAFPDRQWQIDDLVAVDDLVICRLTVSGTHHGVPDIPVEGGIYLKAIVPTGKPYSVQHIHIFRIERGKIAEHWAARDDLGLLEQLGGLPQPQLIPLHQGES
jgi:predicted ester cyclase